MTVPSPVDAQAPPRAFIPLCVPEIGGNEWVYVKECLDTNWVSSVGTFVDRFERAVAERLGIRFAVATVNGTAALHVALLVAGVKPDDEVLVSSLSFIAPANAIRYVGAWPVFVDAEPRFWQMDPGKLLDFLDDSCERRHGAWINRTTGRTVRALLPVHILGHPVDMDPVIAAARSRDLVVVEDATESLGALYRGMPVGRAGDVSCLSFNGNKLITTGGGGMILTDNEAWARRAKYLTTQAKDEPVEFIHGEIGFNYRLTNLQAAMGVAQMERLDAYIAAKRRIAARYTGELGGLDGITPPAQADWAASVFWLYTVLLDEAACGVNARALRRHLAGRRIETRPLWQPLHRSPAHAGATATDCSVAEWVHERALSLPCSVGLPDSAQTEVIAQVRDVLGAGLL